MCINKLGMFIHSFKENREPFRDCSSHDVCGLGPISAHLHPPIGLGLEAEIYFRASHAIRIPV